MAAVGLMRCGASLDGSQNQIEWRSPVMSELPLLVFDVNENLAGY